MNACNGSKCGRRTSAAAGPLYGAYSDKNEHQFRCAKEVPEGGKATGNNYWYCDGSKEYYHADGTFTGRFTDTNFEGYNELLTIWRACRVGTRLPEVAGNWVVVNDSICVRFDTTPGIIACGDIISEPDGNSSTVGGDLEVIQYGQVIESSYEGAETCYLEEE